jgi:hypothetical protein
LILIPQKLGSIRSWSSEGGRTWSPNIRDIAADDWQAGPLENIVKALEAIDHA